METAVLNLNFHLRKPYNEAKTLIDVFNQIIEEGGRCEICISQISSESSEGLILQLKLYRCKNSYSAASLGAKIINNLAKEDFVKITKFNFASIYYCPISFSLEDSNDENHGPIISVSLFENNDSDIQNNINQQFKLIELSAISQ